LANNLKGAHMTALNLPIENTSAGVSNLSTPPELLDMLRVLTSFQPPRISLANAPWETYVDWAISQGLGPLSSYNLEFRLAGADAPEWARDRLLSIYQGSLNDNVMKMVNFRRTISELSGYKVVLLGAASFLETVYPHLAFRPMLDIQLLARGVDIDGVIEHLSKNQFKRTRMADGSYARAILSDGRTEIALYDALWERRGNGQLETVFDRAHPMPIYGPSVFQLRLEDAILSVCVFQSQQAYDAPLITFIDLRELLAGARSGTGPYSRLADVEDLSEAARRWGQERALYASVGIAERLFPEVAKTSTAIKPDLNIATKSLLDKFIVGPASEVGRTRTLKITSKIRRILASR
jgi:hypothetical protein